MIYGYVRVSSKSQNEERQITALKNEGVSLENIFIDKESGKDFNRTAWQKLMAKLIIGDTIVIKELDRMGRNNNEIKENFELIKSKGCFLEFLENPLLSMPLWGVLLLKPGISPELPEGINGLSWIKMYSFWILPELPGRSLNGKLWAIIWHLSVPSMMIFYR